MTYTVFATYDNIKSGHKAIADLIGLGFHAKDIGVAVYDVKNDEISLSADVNSEEGAVTGATFGTFLGAVFGLVSITIPGVGPIIAAGPLTAALGALTGAGIGAASGAITGGLAAAFLNLGVSEDDAHYYAESLRRGMVLVMVQVYEGATDVAMRTLLKHKPVDIDQRVGEWSAEGWERFDPELEPYTAEGIALQRRNLVPETGEHDWDVNADYEEYRNTVRQYPLT